MSSPNQASAKAALPRTPGIITTGQKCTTSEGDPLALVRIPGFNPAVDREIMVTARREGERTTVMRVPLNCLTQKLARLSQPISLKGQVVRQRRRRESLRYDESQAEAEEPATQARPPPIRRSHGIFTTVGDG
jgi:hypothetical protein